MPVLITAYSDKTFEFVRIPLILLLQASVWHRLHGCVGPDIARTSITVVQQLLISHPDPPAC